MIAFSINKGFDITDESYYLINFSFPEGDSFLWSHFNRVVNFFLIFISPGIISLRILRLLLVISGAAFLFAGLKRLIRLLDLSFSIFRREEFLLLLSFSLLSFCFGPLALSYNSLNVFLIEIFFFLLVNFISITISLESSISTKWFIATFFLFFFWTLILINKSSTAIALLPLLAFSFIISGCHKVFLKRKILILLFPIIGLVSIVAGVLYCFDSFSEFTSYLNFIHEISSVSEIYYSQSFSSYLIDDAISSISNFFSVTFIIPFLVLIVIVKSGNSIVKWIGIFVFACCSAYLQLYKGIDSDTYHRNYVTLVLLFASVLLFFSDRKFFSKRANYLLFLLPAFAYSGFFGSAAPSTAQIIFYAPLIVSFYLLIAKDSFGLIRNYFFLVLISGNVLLTFHCVIAFPYRQKNLMSDAIPLKTKSGDDILVNKEFSNTHQSFNNYLLIQHLDTFTYYIPQRDYLGLCYLNNLHLPAGLWITENNKAFSKFLLQKISPQKLNRCLFILNPKLPCSDLFDTLQENINQRGRLEIENQRNTKDTLLFYSIHIK